MGNLQKILRFMAPYRRKIIALMLLTGLLSFIAVLPPLVTKALLDKVFTDRQTDLLFPLACCMVLIHLTNAIGGHIQRLNVSYLGQRFVFDIRSALYKHFLYLSLRFYGKHSTGKLVYRLMGDSGVVQNMLTGQTMTVVSDLVCGTFAICATVLINWRLALLILGIIVIFVVNYRLNIHTIVRASRSARQAYDRLSGGVQNRLVANIAVKTFGAEARENITFAEQSVTALGFQKKQQFGENGFWMNVTLIHNLGHFLIYFAGCAMVLTNSMTYGEVTAFSAYAMQLLWPAVRFSQLINQLQQVAISTDRLFEIFDEKPEITSPPDAMDLQIKGQVSLNDIHFQYEEGKKVIDGVSLHCNPGDTIAFIGSTGCGKSTLLNLIMRFYDVTGGSITVDGVDIRKLDVQKFRRQFGIVLQESLIFSVSIRENICYGRPNATEEEIINAAKTAEIHNFIQSLPDGYDTLVGEYGVELSVGQKQRINLARAVCANPAILIMDEATSSLDSDSELAIQKAMARMLKGRTSFVVAHRLSTIKNATQIIVLDKGRILEQGNHDELMARPDGRYRDLYTKHMGAGVID